MDEKDSDSDITNRWIEPSKTVFSMLILPADVSATERDLDIEDGEKLKNN